MSNSFPFIEGLPLDSATAHSKICLWTTLQAIRDLGSNNEGIARSARRWFLLGNEGTLSFYHCCDVMRFRLQMIGRDTEFNVDRFRQQCLDAHDSIRFSNGTQTVVPSVEDNDLSTHQLPSFISTFLGQL